MADPRKSGALSIGVVDLDAKLRVWRTMMPKAFSRGLRAGIWASVIDVQARAKDLVDGKVLTRRSGDLWRSIQGEVFDRGGTVVGIVGTHVKYAPIHEFGGTIRPKKAGGFLMFKGQDGGFVSVREVKIPRRPYMSRALRERSPRVRKLIRAHVMASIKGTLKTGRVLPAANRRGVAPNVN